MSESNPTAADLTALKAFAATLTETDWNPDVTPYGPCRRGKRLASLGWLVMKRAALRGSGGFMGGTYHPAEYVLTDLGAEALSALSV